MNVHTIASCLAVRALAENVAEKLTQAENITDKLMEQVAGAAMLRRRNKCGTIEKGVIITGDNLPNTVWGKHSVKECTDICEGLSSCRATHYDHKEKKCNFLKTIGKRLHYGGHESVVCDHEGIRRRYAPLDSQHLDDDLPERRGHHESDDDHHDDEMEQHPGGYRRRQPAVLGRGGFLPRGGVDNGLAPPEYRAGRARRAGIPFPSGGGGGGLRTDQDPLFYYGNGSGGLMSPPSVGGSSALPPSILNGILDEYYGSIYPHHPQQLPPYVSHSEPPFYPNPASSLDYYRPVTDPGAGLRPYYPNAGGLPPSHPRYPSYGGGGVGTTGPYEPRGPGPIQRGPGGKDLPRLPTEDFSELWGNAQPHNTGHSHADGQYHGHSHH